jgi:hypothetical protein
VSTGNGASLQSRARAALCSKCPRRRTRKWQCASDVVRAMWCVLCHTTALHDRSVCASLGPSSRTCLHCKHNMPSLIADEQSCASKEKGIRTIRRRALQSVFTAAHLHALASKPATDRAPADTATLSAELRRIPLLATLEPEELRVVTGGLAAEAHAPGSVLTRQGDRGTCMHAIIDGSVNVHVLDEDALAAWRRQPDWPEELPPTLLEVCRPDCNPPAAPTSKCDSLTCSSSSLHGCASGIRASAQGGLPPMCVTSQTGLACQVQPGCSVPSMCVQGDDASQRAAVDADEVPENSGAIAAATYLIHAAHPEAPLATAMRPAPARPSVASVALLAHTVPKGMHRRQTVKWAGGAGGGSEQPPAAGALPALDGSGQGGSNGGGGAALLLLGLPAAESGSFADMHRTASADSEDSGAQAGHAWQEQQVDAADSVAGDFGDDALSAPQHRLRSESRPPGKEEPGTLASSSSEGASGRCLLLHVQQDPRLAVQRRHSAVCCDFLCAD